MGIFPLEPLSHTRGGGAGPGPDPGAQGIASAAGAALCCKVCAGGAGGDCNCGGISYLPISVRKLSGGGGERSDAVGAGGGWKGLLNSNFLQVQCATRESRRVNQYESSRQGKRTRQTWTAAAQTAGLPMFPSFLPGLCAAVGRNPEVRTDLLTRTQADQELDEMIDGLRTGSVDAAVRDNAEAERQCR
jgi:hypothetical protein